MNKLSRFSGIMKSMEDNKDNKNSEVGAPSNGMRKQFLLGLGIGVVIIAATTVALVLLNKIDTKEEIKTIPKTVLTKTEFGDLFPDGRYFDLRKNKEILVDAGDNFFQPPHIVISAGTKIIWQNKGDLEHFIYSDADPTMNALLSKKGSVFTKTFNKPGTYPYYCKNHPEMKGLIIVM